MIDDFLARHLEWPRGLRLSAIFLDTRCRAIELGSDSPFRPRKSAAMQADISQSCVGRLRCCLSAYCHTYHTRAFSTKGENPKYGQAKLHLPHSLYE